jgi:hypothetical protein
LPKYKLIENVIKSFDAERDQRIFNTVLPAIKLAANNSFVKEDSDGKLAETDASHVI